MTSQPRREWRSTGQTVEGPGSLVHRPMPEHDPRGGEHLWIVVTVHRVRPELWTDPTHTPILDVESLLTVDGPGCYFCEQTYTPLLAKRRCTGEPR